MKMMRPMVSSPWKRCGVSLNSTAMPPVLIGNVNHAHVKWRRREWDAFLDNEDIELVLSVSRMIGLDRDSSRINQLVES
jgi:hypothetical protein